jgi:hypothetical protein
MDVDTLKEETKWMVVMRLPLLKPFSATSLKKIMCFAWAPTQEVFFRNMEENKFIVHANCLGDCRESLSKPLDLFETMASELRTTMGVARPWRWRRTASMYGCKSMMYPSCTVKTAIILDLVAYFGEVIPVDLRVDGGDFLASRSG